MAEVIVSTHCSSIIKGDIVEYTNKIREPFTWGGELELTILAEEFSIEIGVAHVEMMNVYNIGQDKNYQERIYILYDGVHYDALYKKGSGQSKFPTTDDEVYAQAFQAAAAVNSTGGYYNSYTCSLYCDICGMVFKGEEGITDHSLKTRHAAYTQFQPQSFNL